MEELVKNIEEIIRTKFKEIAFCQITYQTFLFFEDEILIQVYEREPVLEELYDENYVEHSNMLADEIRERFSDKIKGIDIWNAEYLGFIGIEIKVNMKKIKRASDDIDIIIMQSSPL